MDLLGEVNGNAWLVKAYAFPVPDEETGASGSATGSTWPAV